MDQPSPLTAQLLMAAYSRGYFPMAEADGTLGWHDPDPRAIFPLETVRPNARLRRHLRQSGFRCTVDQAFEEVMRACATLHGPSWITDEMVRAYSDLHRIGHAHSVETWDGTQLVGGLYGVHLGAAFFGESMFSTRSHASKAAFHHLVERLRGNGFSLFDTQYLNPHTASLGAIEVPRAEFRMRLRRAISTVLPEDGAFR